MKCKICGFDIVDGQETCNGCGTSVEALKQAGNIEYEYVEEPVVDPSAAPVQVEETPSEEPVEAPAMPEIIVEDEGEPLPVPEEAAPEVQSIEVPTYVAPEIEQTPVESQPEVVQENLLSGFETPDVVEQPQNVETPVESQSVNSVEPITAPVVEPTPVVETPTTEVVPTPVVETPTAEVVPTPEVSVAPVVETPVQENTSSAPVIETAETPAAPVNPDKTKEAKKKGKISPIFIILIVLLLAVTGGVAYIHFGFGSGYNVVSRTLTNITTLSKNTVDNSKKNSETSLKISFKYTGESDLSILNDTKILVNTKNDITNGFTDLTLGLEYNEDTLSLDALLRNKVLYLTSKDLFEKTIEVPLEEDMEELYNSYKDNLKNQDAINRVVSTTLNYISESLKDQKYTKEYTNKTINDKLEGVVKTTLVLTDKDLEQVTKNVIEKLQNDQQFITDLKTITGKTEAEIKDELKEMIDDVDYTGEKVTLVIYTDYLTTTFYSAEILIEEETGKSTISFEKSGDFYILSGNFEDEFKFTLNTRTKKFGFTIGNEKESLNVVIEYNINNSEEVKLAEIPEETVKIDTLTEKDQEKISKNLENSKVIKELMTKIEEMNSSSDITIDDTIDTTIDVNEKVD